MRLPLLGLALLPLLCACQEQGDCIDGLESQLRCGADDTGRTWIEICADGDWQTLSTCDTTAGQICATCVAADAGGQVHACTTCPGGTNAVAQCALATPAATCP